MENEMERFLQVCADLESGKIRVAEKKDGEWIVNSWIKEVILSGFRLGKLHHGREGHVEGGSGAGGSPTRTAPRRQIRMNLLLTILFDGITYASWLFIVAQSMTPFFIGWRPM